MSDAGTHGEWVCSFGLPDEAKMPEDAGSRSLNASWKGRHMQRNLTIPKNHSIRKKVRGSKRKIASLERKLDSILLSIPDESLPHGKSWRYHLPRPSKLVDSTNSPYRLRKKFLQLLADKLVELDSTIEGKYKTLLLLSFPFLSDSRIDICVDNKYFEKLLNNEEAPSSWTPMSADKDIVKELNIAMPKGYASKGYFRISTDLNTRRTEENWIIWKAK